MAQLDFWYEFASPYSYPAALTVTERAKSRGVGVNWRPILLGPIFASQGWSDSPFNLFPAKGRYMWRDMERICAALNLPFKRPAPFCAEILTAMGLKADEILARAESQAVKDALKAETDASMTAGIFGAPSFSTPSGELFWGFDRMEAAIAWTAQHG